VAASDDGTIKVLNLQDFTVSTALTGHEGAVQCVALAPNDAYLVRPSPTVTQYTILHALVVVLIDGHVSVPVSRACDVTGLRVVRQHLPRVGIVCDAATVTPQAKPVPTRALGLSICVFSVFVAPTSLFMCALHHCIYRL
jgi:hypothetical protein